MNPGFCCASSRLRFWQITQGSNQTIDHDANRNRFRHSQSGKVTLYLGNGLYEKTTQGATVTHTHYIKAGSQLVALYKSATGGESTRYVHTDHLGSLTELTNETGGVDEYLSYDAWGKRRDSDWSEAAGQLYATNTKRGYTSHEHLEGAGLVYDPDIGRFLSPDPFIPQPTFTGSYMPTRAPSPSRRPLCAV
ncbi:MAG TPA: hypothetical protein VJN91_09730 [Gammaproteobacteria bacterium]|nr:hypothetical protein [Gammaproteobacteria bacterium]